MAEEYPGIDFAYGDGVATNMTPKALFLLGVVSESERKLKGSFSGNTEHVMLRTNL